MQKAGFLTTWLILVLENSYVKVLECKLKKVCVSKVNQPTILNQRTNGPVNAHLISWPSKAQNIQNLENIWAKIKK